MRLNWWPVNVSRLYGHRRRLATHPAPSSAETTSRPRIFSVSFSVDCGGDQRLHVHPRRFDIQRTTTKCADLGVQVRRPRRALRARQHLTLAVLLGVKQSHEAPRPTQPCLRTSSIPNAGRRSGQCPTDSDILLAAQRCLPNEWPPENARPTPAAAVSALGTRVTPSGDAQLRS